MDVDMGGKFHIHGKPGNNWQLRRLRGSNEETMTAETEV